ncbi:MAG: hypothetical protein AABZ39_06955 [Spirochaetota bacterium]
MPQYYRVLLLSALGIVANLLIILGFVLFFKHEGLRINYARYNRHMVPLANAVDAVIDAKERKARAVFSRAELPGAIEAFSRGGAAARKIKSAAMNEIGFTAISFFDARGALLYSTAPDIEKGRGIGLKSWYGAFDRHVKESGFVAIDAEEHAIKIAYPAVSDGRRTGSVVFDVPKRAVFGDPSKSVYFRSVEFTPAGVLLVLKNAPVSIEDVPLLTRALTTDAVQSERPKLLPAFRERALMNSAVIAVASRTYPSVSIMIAVKRILPLTYALFIVLVLLFVPLIFFFFTLVSHLMRLGDYKAQEESAFTTDVDTAEEPIDVSFTAHPVEDSYQAQMRSLPDTIAVNRMRDTDEEKAPAIKESDYFSSDKAFTLETMDRDFLVPDLPTDVEVARVEIPDEVADAADVRREPPTLEPEYPSVIPEFAIDDDVIGEKPSDDVVVDISDRLPEGALDELPADEPAEIIKVPDDYFGKEPTTAREGLSDLISDVNGRDAGEEDGAVEHVPHHDDEGAWRTVIDDFAARTLVSVSLMDIMESLERELSVSAKKCLMLEKTEAGMFTVTEAFDIEEATRTGFTIDPEGAFYQSMLSKKKTVYIKSNPFSYEGLAATIGERDKADTERMLFMPVFDDGGDIKGFFVLMNAAPKG